MKRIRYAVAAASIIAGVSVMGGATAAFAGGCSVRSASTTFSRWGDRNLYFPASTFEPGEEGWTLRNGARVGLGQTDWLVNGGEDHRNLRLSAGSSATSPSICVHSNEQTLRFFYRSAFIGSRMEVKVTVSNSKGVATTKTVVTADSFGWDVSPIIPLPELRETNGQQWITITMTPKDWLFSSWQVDDVMIDPWVAR